MPNTNINSDPTFCAYCEHAIDEADNWVFNQKLGYLHDRCGNEYRDDLRYEAADAKLTADFEEAA